MAGPGPGMVSGEVHFKMVVLSACMERLGKHSEHGARYPLI